jgi:hypothetical protein
VPRSSPEAGPGPTGIHGNRRGDGVALPAPAFAHMRAPECRSPARPLGTTSRSTGRDFSFLARAALCGGHSMPARLSSRTRRAAPAASKSARFRREGSAPVRRGAGRLLSILPSAARCADRRLGVPGRHGASRDLAEHSQQCRHERSNTRAHRRVWCQRAVGQESDSRRALACGQRPRREGVIDEARDAPVRQWEHVRRDHGEHYPVMACRSRCSWGCSWTRSPRRRPWVMWMASRSPRRIWLRTVWRASPSWAAASASRT